MAKGLKNFGSKRAAPFKKGGGRDYSRHGSIKAAPPKVKPKGK